MAYPTFKPIVQEVLMLMGQVSGSGVQTYTEPMVKTAVNRIFDYLWNKRKWEHLWHWKAAQIAANGRLTADLPDLLSYLDVALIRDARTKRPIIAPLETEHLYVTGSSPLYRTVLPWNDPQAETRFFQFYPIGATGAVEIYCGIRPEKFESDDDIVPMDEGLMVNGAAWFMLTDDGSNPATADKYQGMFDLTYQNIVANNNAQPIGHGGGRRSGSTVFIQPT